MKKIIIIPDSFKGSLSSLEVCNAIEEGILKVFKNIEIKKIPIADGGEGTVDSVLYATGGKIKKVSTDTFIVTPCNVDLEGDDVLGELESHGVYF